MDKTKALQNLLKGKATKKEIELLQQALASGEISIRGDVNRSVVIIGSGNKVELTPDALGILKSETKTEEPVEGDPPYMGLRYFDTQDADLFYGREALTRELLARVEKESFLAIVGASGSGKSSVARAGLIPAWKQENERSVVHVITPTAHPLESLAASLTRESESVTATSLLMDDLAKDSRILRLYVKKGLGETKLLLLIDQFEETFTLCKDEAERKAFIENLLSLADDDSARVVITLRADFYHHCAEYEGLRLTLEKHQTYIGAMTADELRQAITTPAEAKGWDFQLGLVDLILSDVGAEPGALPLLSHALLETWKRRQGRTLTLQGYHEAGGVKKAIAQTAESVYDRLTPTEQVIARGIFLRLTELGEGAQDTRRRVKMDELAQSKEQDSVAKVLKTLADARLVTTEQESAEVAHEALIREWGTLRKWLDEDRESLRLYRYLTESAGEWERADKEDVFLIHRGSRLESVITMSSTPQNTLNKIEQEYLDACVNLSEKEKRAQRFRLISMTGVFVVALITISVVLTLAITGQVSRLMYPPLPMEWIEIPAGEFLMGSSDRDIAEAVKTCPSCDIANEQPQHLVYLDVYQIGKYEVTNEQYYQCVKAGACNKPTNKDYEKAEFQNHPVTDITWEDALTFCEWNSGRLPTEAEWEKAARGNATDIIDTRIYPWGNQWDPQKANINGGDIGMTMPVGSYSPIGDSIYKVSDMSGNVWEWVMDWYDEGYYAISSNRNPRGVDIGKYRVLRGGSFANSAVDARSTYRGYNYISSISNDVGIRCVK